MSPRKRDRSWPPADAVAERYPGMWEDGAGRAEMVRQWSDGRGLTWRLYRFTG